MDKLLNLGKTVDDTTKKKIVCILHYYRVTLVNIVMHKEYHLLHIKKYKSIYAPLLSYV